MFHIPHTVGQRSTPSACNLLLLEAPIRKLDFMGEESTASHLMNELKLGLNGPDSLLCQWSIREVLNDLDAENIVCIPCKVLMTICAAGTLATARKSNLQGFTHETSFCQSASVTGGLTS